MKKELPKNLPPTENGENYLNQTRHVSLEFTEKDLKNPGVAKRILADNQSLKREVSTLKESLKVSQNTFEKLRNKHHEIDKENAILKERTSLLSKFEIIKSLSLIGIGSAVTLLLNKDYIFAAIIGVLSVVILFITILPKGSK